MQRKKFDKNCKRKRPIVIVFDLDETLGSYCDLNIIWEYFKYNIKFNSLLDLFPEFSRCGIFSILHFIYQKKINGQCDKIFIYTNNKCCYEFVELISKYFSYKLEIKDGELFDQIIRTFKVNGQIVEGFRTTQHKTHNDFIRCTLLPPKTQICFIDDVYHPRMVDEKVYYINLKPYVHHLPFDSMLNKFTTSKEELDLPTFTEKFNTHLKNYSFVYNEKQKEEYEIDKIVTKKTMVMLQEFFNKNNPNCSRKSRKHTCLRVNHKTAKNKN